MERVEYVVKLENVFLEVPVPNFELPFKTFKEFPSFCGAGSGIGDMLVPETIWGLNISPACYVHDQGFLMAQPNLLDFYDCNRRFITNIEAINNGRSKSQFLKALRRYRMASYVNAVEIHGKRCFWKVKHEQGHQLPSVVLNRYGLA